MELRSNYFKMNMNDACKDIITDQMIEMIAELSANAIFIMNTDVDGSVTSRTTEIIIETLKNSKFRYMPFNLVMEGFYRGSMGELGGTTRFTVRNVCTWMNVMYEKLAQINTAKKTMEDAERRKEGTKAYKQSQKQSALYGSAYYWKISHCPMSDTQYDRLTLDKIVEAIKKGYSLKELEPNMIL